MSKENKINYNCQKKIVEFVNSNFEGVISLKLGGSLQVLKWKRIAIIQGSVEDTEYFSNYSSSVLFPFPGRIDKGGYAIDGRQYQLPINEGDRGHALHGLLYDKEFKLISQEIKGQDVEIVLSYTSKGEEFYPFPFVFQVKYVISDNEVFVEFSITNTGKTIMPFALGWHPYFAIDDTYELTFESEAHVEADDLLIPVQTIQKKESQLIGINNVLDTSFKNNKGRVVLKTNEYALEMVSDTMEYTHVYTPDHKKTVAIEPMTSVPNVFNYKEGLKLLGPKTTETYNLKLNLI